MRSPINSNEAIAADNGARSASSAYVGQRARGDRDVRRFALPFIAVLAFTGNPQIVKGIIGAIKSMTA